MRICHNITAVELFVGALPGTPKSVYCGHPVSDHDSGGCCKVNRCPCSHLVLSKADEFDPARTEDHERDQPETGKGETMTVFGMLRIKNEGRWIREVIAAALPLCERVFVLDDHSTDATDEICERMGPKVTVIRSAFEGFDESRDREYLLGRVMNGVSDVHLRGDERSPFWALAIDGDELLDPAGVAAIRETLADTRHHAFKLPIRYLWNADLTRVMDGVYDEAKHGSSVGHRSVRMDGVYQTFARPSIFRLMNRNFRFQRTPFGNGANFHCSSIPQELLHAAHVLIPGAPLWHLGYNDRADRVRKYEWYNRLDPHNESEDSYRHMVQGDVPEIPAEAVLKHAGPLRLEMM